MFDRSSMTPFRALQDGRTEGSLAAVSISEPTLTVVGTPQPARAPIALPGPPANPQLAVPITPADTPPVLALEDGCDGQRDPYTNVTSGARSRSPTARVIQETLCNRVFVANLARGTSPIKVKKSRRDRQIRRYC